MTVVVADTSPLNYLVLVGAIQILPVLYGSILIPDQVLAELTDPAAPLPVLDWIRTQPQWLEVRAVPDDDSDSRLTQIDSGRARGDRFGAGTAKCLIAHG
jgi:predicted nucleic acid-binding protein